MWEQISSNRRKSFFLVILMGLLLLLLGFILGEAFIGQGAGVFGVLIASAVWIILMLVSYFGGSSILLSMSNAKEVTPDVHQQLYNVVEEMKIASGMEAMPKVYIIDEEAPNAFATGRNPQTSAVAVTSGLLARLNRDELQGVIAHEVSHIINRDILLMTFTGVMLGSITFLSEILLRGSVYGGSRYRSRESNNSGGNQIMVIVAIVFAILAPIFAQLLYFAVSRKREYLADSSAARLTRYPEGLASALEKIANNAVPMRSANKVTAPMYIANPLQLNGNKLSDLTSTHPPISERIKILRAMMHGASYLDYEQAFVSVKGKEGILPTSALTGDAPVPLRDASETTSTNRKQKRAAGDAVMALNQYRFVECTCGVKLKIPPELKTAQVGCPRCGAVHTL